MKTLKRITESKTNFYQFLFITTLSTVVVLIAMIGQIN